MDEKHRVLSQVFGYREFRGGQETLIDAQLAGRDAFGVMPTGGGKSLCYEIPALLLEGAALVVCPLISLMKDQVAALTAAGVPAAYINSSLTPEQIRTVYRYMLAGRYKIVYVAPERLLTEGFLRTVDGMRISLVAVDEAHCISQWGQDFRPSYLRIAEFLEHFPERPVVSAFTATATEQVRRDIVQILRLREPAKVVTGFDRPNLYFAVRRPRNRAEEVLELVRARPEKSGIVYCATRKDVEKVCAMLQSSGIGATRYHAGLPEDERHRNQDDFIYDRAPVMVATNAFGMGIDKSNVSYVIHYNMPQSLEAYYQEAGRAGRDGTDAECILLYGAGDIRTAKFFIDNPGNNTEMTPEQRETVRRQDLIRLNKMVGYCKTTGCLRSYILDYFGQSHGNGCGNCGNCCEKLPMQDMTTEAKMILSCVCRIRDKLGYTLGAAKTAAVLRGSRGAFIRELGLDTLPTCGLLHEVSRTEVGEMIDCLEEQGYLHTDEASGALCLTEQAGQVLFHGEQVLRPVRASVKPVRERKSVSAAEDPELYEVLRSLRAQIAGEQHVPAYVVFSNAALQDMAAKAPVTPDEFRSVSGVGRVKANAYGKRFCNAIRAYLAEKADMVRF